MRVFILTVWGIGLRLLGCGCGRRLVTGFCVIRETTPTGCRSISIYPPTLARPRCNRPWGARHRGANPLLYTGFMQQRYFGYNYVILAITTVPR